MKTLKTLLTLCVLLLASTSLYAQDYYVCDSGNDNNDGKSDATPFKTYEKGLTQFNQLSGGESVLFCRGGVFPISAEKRVANFKCDKSSVCTIADYGDSAKNKPIVIASNVNGINFEDGGNADADGGYVVRNLIFKSTTKTKVGIRFYNDVNDVVIDNVQVQGFVQGLFLAGANTPNSGSNRINENIVLKNSFIYSNAAAGWLGGCSDCAIINNTFENNGFGHAVFDHNLYFSNPWKKSPANNVLISGNTLYKSTRIDGKCRGVSLVVHGQVNNLTIENNYVHEDVGAVSDHCWGISVDPGYSSEESFENLVIRNNKLENMGNVGIGCASCKGVLIENNEIIDHSGVLAWGIKVPVRKEDSVKSSNVSIRGNSINLIDLTSTGIHIGGENAFSVKNNIINQLSNVNSCITKTGANLLTDTSLNTCVQGGKTIVDETPIDETPIDETPIDETPIDETRIDATPKDTSSTDTSSTDTSSTDTSSTDTSSTDTSSTFVSAVYISPGYSSLTNHVKSTKNLKLTCRALSSSGRCLMR